MVRRVNHFGISLAPFGITSEDVDWDMPSQEISLAPFGRGYGITRANQFSGWDGDGGDGWYYIYKTLTNKSWVFWYYILYLCIHKTKN